MQTIKLKRGTAANWTAVDPTLAAGEIGIETDTTAYKIGDGDTAWTALPYGGRKFGAAATDFSEFEADGTLKFNGAATVYRDELQSLAVQLKNNPSDKIVLNIAEGTTEWKNNAGLDDYAVMNVQLNHDRKQGSQVFPHIHFFQNQDAVPNWLFQYRWQVNGRAKTADWTDLPCSTLVFAYTSGTLNQIARTASGIAAPDPDGLSDILQLRIIRDTGNDSGEFAGVDPYTGNAAATNADAHIEMDTVGSRQEIIK
jgi:hypothetical protein